MNWIEKSLNELLTGKKGEIFSRIECLGSDLEIDGTEAKGYCYCVKLDAHGNPRTKDLIEFIATKIVDYSIPKKMLDEAREYMNETNSSAKILDLRKKATTLFTGLNKTGEFGEMMLYILAQEVLKLPQLISKMSLKTSGNVHYHGADGVHVKYEESDDSLSLYWGESKVEKTAYSALNNCFESLKGFLLDTIGNDATQARDLQLITSNITDNTNNSKLEDLLVRYFDLDDDLSNKLNYKGVCFVGFDSSKYPNNPLELTMDELKESFEEKINSWLNTTGASIKKHLNLERFEIHVFILPFPSVQDMRDHFLSTIKS